MARKVYRRKKYVPREEETLLRETSEMDHQTKEVVSLINRGYKWSAYKLAIYYGVPYLISLAIYALGLGYVYFNPIRI